MYIISNVKDIYEEDFIKDKSLEIFPNSVLIKYSNFKNKEEKVLYNYSETQALQDGLLTKIFYVAEELKRKSEINVENDLKEILVQNENLSIEELQELHQKATSQAIIKDITSSYIENKIIIYTKYENCIHYLEELSKFKTVATTSVSDYMKENETIQNLKRENGTIENYKKESLNDFNNDNLEILVVSSLEELQKIVTPNVTKIYKDIPINVKILQEITEILSKKNKNKNIGILIDFAKNNELIANYKKESQNVQDISILINKTRVLLLDLVSKANKIEEKLKENKSINNILTIIEIEEYQILVKSLIEKLFFLFSSEKQIEKIPKDKIKIYKESLKMILKLLDKISVIYAKEIEDPNQIEKLCKIMGIENFAFTVISKNDIIQYPNLSGTWKELKFCQKVEALKNRLKIYMFYSDKTTLDMVESDYIEGKIDKTTYFNYIEKFKEDYVRKVINKKIPTEIKKSRFSEILYENIKNKMYLKALNVNSEEILINLILNLKQDITQEIKINWKQNLFVRKKVRLIIIEELYMRMEMGEISIPEETFDTFLEEIEKIALETLDVTNTENKDKFYYIKKKNAFAMGKRVGDKFLVLKNSTTVEGYSQKMNGGYLLLIKELSDKEIIKNDKFVKDYLFSSSSAAANVILGRSANGRIEWKDEFGKTLAENEM